MSREIKFRAWDRKEAEFFYLELNHGDTHPGPMEDQCNNLDLESWEQFTGLKDKGGRDIYEGDIVRADHNGGSRIGYVVFHGAEFRIAFSKQAMAFQIETGYNESGVFAALWWMLKGAPGHVGHDEMNGEVIGTIHENPELLK